MPIPKATKLPSGNWNIKMMVKGKRVSVTAKTKRDVEYKARQMRDRMESDTTPDRAHLTLGEATDRYLDARTDIISPTTMDSYRSYRKNHFKSVIDRPVASVEDWEEILNEEAKKYSSKTVKNVWALFEPVIEYCGLPKPKVSLPQVVMESRNFLEIEQIHPFMTMIRGDDYELPFLLGLESMRISEISALTRDKITDTHIIVHGARVKTTKGMVYREANKTDASRREIKIVIPRIHELKDNFDWDWLKNRPLEAYSIRLRKLALANGYQDLTMHCLRHTFVTLCFYLKISPYDCMLWGGWHDIQTIYKHYRHLANRERQISEQNLAQFFSDPDFVGNSWVMPVPEYLHE